MNQRIIVVGCKDIWSSLIGASFSAMTSEDQIRSCGITDVMIESCGEGDTSEVLFLFKLDKRLELMDKYLKERKYYV